MTTSSGGNSGIANGTVVMRFGPINENGDA